MKRLLHLAALFAVLLCSGASWAADGLTGHGTKDQPYQISSAEDLVTFANLINNGEAKSVGQLDYCVTAYAMLTQDIDLSSVCSAEKGSWTPIGDWQHRFNGAFWGCGHKITGLYVKNEDDSYSVGLFGETIGAEIRDLEVNGSIDAAGSYKVALLCGLSFETKFINCITRGSVKGYMYVGAITGYDNKGSISYCRNYADVTNNDGHCGVFAGEVIRTTITNCFNAGSVTVEGDDPYGGCYSLYGFVNEDKVTTSSLLDVGSINANVSRNTGDGIYNLVPDDSTETATNLHASTIKSTLGAELGWTETDENGWPVPTTNVYFPEVKYYINVDSTDHGSVLVTAYYGHVAEASAPENKDLEAKITPDEGYVLKTFSVKDQHGSDVAVKGGRWFDEKAIFRMPASDVTVSAEFVPKDSFDYPVTLGLNGKEPYVQVSADIDTIRIYNNPISTERVDTDAYQRGAIMIPEGYCAHVTGTVSNNDDGNSTFIISTYEEDIYRKEGVEGTDSVDFYFESIADNDAINFNIHTNNSQLLVNLTVAIFKKEAHNIEVTTDGNSTYTLSGDATAMGGDTITVGITPKEGFYVNHVDVVETATGKSLRVTGGNWNKPAAQFIMPYESGASVNIVCTDTIRAEYTMPLVPKGEREATDTLRLTKDFNKLTLYDDGGSTMPAQSEKYSRSNLVIMAPEGYNILINGEMTTKKESHGMRLTIWKSNDLGIYYSDGEGKSRTEGDKKIYTVSVMSDSVADIIQDITTENAENIVFTIEAVKFEQRSLTVSPDIKGGTVTLSTDTAKCGDRINLEVTPDEGYLLKSVSVVTASGDTIAVTGKQEVENLYKAKPAVLRAGKGGTRIFDVNGMYANILKGSFIMPDDDVTVSAELTRDSTLVTYFFSEYSFLSDPVNINLANSQMHIIMDNVSDGGRNIGLEINIPEGYELKLEGTAYVPKYLSTLEIVNGDNALFTQSDTTANVSFDVTSKGNVYITYGNDFVNDLSDRLEFTATLMKDGVPTGIDEVNCSAASSSRSRAAIPGVFTLTGQKVASSAEALQSLPAGIYIVNGRKVAVR